MVCSWLYFVSSVFGLIPNRGSKIRNCLPLILTVSCAEYNTKPNHTKPNLPPSLRWFENRTEILTGHYQWIFTISRVKTTISNGSVFEGVSLKQLPKHSGGNFLKVIMPLRKPHHHHDQQPSDGLFTALNWLLRGILAIVFPTARIYKPFHGSKKACKTLDQEENQAK